MAPKWKRQKKEAEKEEQILLQESQDAFISLEPSKEEGVTRCVKSCRAFQSSPKQSTVWSSKDLPKGSLPGLVRTEVVALRTQRGHSGGEGVERRLF